MSPDDGAAPGTEDLIGFADLHNHQFGNLGFGGRLVWGSPTGDLADGMPTCEPRHGRWGWRDLPGNVVASLYRGRPVPGHRTSGYPGFAGWPAHDSVTHQAVHVDWLERAVRGGLRLMVMLAVNNDRLASPGGGRDGPRCTDMEAVDAQLAAARDLERSIDERYGGPGSGWYRIVTTPEQGRRAVAAEKLAVVLGIEVDHLFGCRRPGDLDDAALVGALDRYHGLGVRHLFPVHYGNNGFGGGAFETALVRAVDQPRLSRANPVPTLPWYEMETEDGRADGLEYRTGRRNRLGLTRQGRRLVEEMVQRGIVIDINHMSTHAKRETLDLCEQVGYPVVAGHTGFLALTSGDRCHEGQLAEVELQRLAALGGMVGVILDQQSVPGPDAGRATSRAVARAYAYAVDEVGGGPVAIGTDFNGLARLPGPRFPTRTRGAATTAEPPPVAYPFCTRTGERMGPAVAGERSYDINRDGVAHVGLLPDFVAELEALGTGAGRLDPLMRSAAGYLDLWERAVGRSRSGPVS